MKLIVAIFGVFAAMLSVASTPVNVVPDAAFEYSINRQMGALAYKYSLGKVIRQGHAAVGVFDVAQQGYGVAATSTSYDTGIHLPNKAIIRRVLFDVVTAPVLTLGSVQIGFTSNAALDLKALTALGTWTGEVDGIPAGATANNIKLTAARTIYAVISSSSVGTLTAGKIKVFVDYVVSE
jgi:hypothetical protein